MVNIKNTLHREQCLKLDANMNDDCDFNKRNKADEQYSDKSSASEQVQVTNKKQTKPLAAERRSQAKQRNKMSSLHQWILFTLVTALIVQNALLACCSSHVINKRQAEETTTTEEPESETDSPAAATTTEATTTTTTSTTTTTAPKPEKAKIPPVNFTLVDELFDATFDEQEVVAKWKHMDKQIVEGKFSVRSDRFDLRPRQP